MKRIFIIFATLFISLCSYGQSDDTIIATMLEQANTMGKKFLDKDYAGFLKYSHPETIKTLGGESNALRKISTELQKIEEEGISFISLNFGAPSKIIRVDSELQSTLPQIMEMHVPGGIVTATTTMLAISMDNGKSWHFLDTANYDHNDMKMLLPNLSDEIHIPERTDPSFEPDPKENIKTE